MCTYRIVASLDVAAHAEAGNDSVGLSLFCIVVVDIIMCGHVGDVRRVCLFGRVHGVLP